MTRGSPQDKNTKSTWSTWKLAPNGSKKGPKMIPGWLMIAPKTVQDNPKSMIKMISWHYSNHLLYVQPCLIQIPGVVIYIPCAYRTDGFVYVWKNCHQSHLLMRFCWVEASLGVFDHSKRSMFSVTSCMSPRAWTTAIVSEFEFSNQELYRCRCCHLIPDVSLREICGAASRSTFRVFLNF